MAILSAWFIIEFAIVIAIAIIISWQINPFFEDSAVMYGWECEQESQETNCTISDEPESTTNNHLIGYSGEL